jgi:competence protein ComEA
MVSRGADVPDEDIETVVEYLAKNFGTDKVPPAHSESEHQSQSVNVNKATAVQLADALGLSSKESAAIVSYREQNGAFKEWQDLAKVPGLEMEKIECQKNRIVF